MLHVFLEIVHTQGGFRTIRHSIFIDTSRVPVEGKSSVCLICMKYRIIILIIIIIRLGQILSYIANTSRMHACPRVRAHTRRRTGYHYSVVPNRDGPLRWRQCWSLVIEINTGAGGTVSQRLWVFFAYEKITGRTETRTRDRICFQSIRTV